MADDLPKDYDTIVLGTGMTECIVAAALSRIGQKVLHLDRNDYYSGDWGTFHFKGIQEWIDNQRDPECHGLKAKDVDLTALLKEGEKTIDLHINANSVTTIVTHTHVEDSSSVQENNSTRKSEESPSKTIKDDSGNNGERQDKKEPAEAVKPSDLSTLVEPTEKHDRDQASNVSGVNDEEEIGHPAGVDEEEKTEKEPYDSHKIPDWTVERLNKEFRKFNIDLHPRILFSRGAMVELLISSDIAKYCEFRTITRVLTNMDGKLERVPCSRSDVFSSKQVSMIEKRMLMKFLTFCLDYEQTPDEYAGFENKSFSEFLKSKKLTKNVAHYVQHAIAMVSELASTLDGLKSTQKFLQSLGRYGNTAFLWPLYGSGELPQCFCRMCAVFGGTYCLRRTGAQLIIDSDNQCQGIVDTEGVRLNAKWIIAESSYLTEDFFLGQEMAGKISRGILFTDKSILADSSEHISLLSFPGGDGNNIVTVLELSSSSLACPKDIYMVHLTCKGISTAEEDFKDVIEFLFVSKDTGHESSESRPKVLWSLFFTQKDTSTTSLKESLPKNLFGLNGPDLALDFDYSITKAKEIFDTICPGEEFLPKAPNPEDIIFDDGAVASNEGSGFEGTTQGAEGNKQNEQTDNSLQKDVAEPEKNKDDISESNALKGDTDLDKDDGKSDNKE